MAASVNYAALLGVIAAAAFAVPLLAAAGAALGLPRGTGFVVSLLAAVALTSYWWVRARGELAEQERRARDEVPRG